MRSWKKYPKYKDSGVEWLGEIPDGWLLKRIKLASPITNKKIDRVNQDLQYIALENIESWTGKYKQSIGEIQPESMVNIFCENNVIFGKLRPYLAKVYQTNNDGVCSSEFFVLKPKDLTPEYLFDFLLNREFIDIINSSTYGAKMPRANWDFFGNQMISIPSLPEQTAIASFLDRETTRIDALIEKKQRQIELLQEKRAALISQAVTKGLDPTVPMKDSGVPWLGEVPEHWRVIHLKRISPQITVGIVITPSKYYVDEGVPCLRSLNIKENYILNEDLVYISEESNLLHSKSKIYKGDLVSVRTGQTGTTTVVNENFNGCNCIDLIIIRKSNDFDSDYLSYVLNSDLAKTKYSLESAGSIQSHFNIEMASNMIIPLPPLEEQILIRKYIVTKAQNIEKTYRKISESISLIQEYRSTLISAAVTGKIDVRDEATA